jgi:hypothetical protein
MFANEDRYAKIESEKSEKEFNTEHGMVHAWQDFLLPHSIRVILLCAEMRKKEAANFPGHDKTHSWKERALQEPRRAESAIPKTLLTSFLPCSFSRRQVFVRWWFGRQKIKKKNALLHERFNMRSIHVDRHERSK